MDLLESINKSTSGFCQHNCVQSKKEVFQRSHVINLRKEGKFEESHAYCLGFPDNPDALAEIGLDYRFGPGVLQDQKLGFQYDTLSAEKGSVRGLYQVGEDYYGGYGVEVSFDTGLAEALRRFKEAAAMGCTDAKLQIAQMYLYGLIGRDEKGKRSLQKAYELFHE